MKNFFALNQIFCELKIPKNPFVIKIIGTNGKGSTGRFLAQMLENYEGKNPFCSEEKVQIPEAFKQKNKINLDDFFAQFGWPKFFKKIDEKNEEKIKKNLEKNLKKNQLKIAHFSSPHLLSFYERFYCNYLDEISLQNRCEMALAWVYERLKNSEKFKNYELNFFDYLCIIFALVFYDANVQIIEAGIGAKSDSTRVFDGFVNLLTSISFDHFEYFKNMQEIYYEKSCIKGTIITSQNNPYLPILRAFGQKIYLVNVAKISAKNCLEKSEVLKQNFRLANLAFKFLTNGFYEGEKIAIKMPARRQNLRGALIECAHNVGAIKELVNENKNKRFLCFLALKNTKENQKIISLLAPMCRAFAAINELAKKELKAAKNLQNKRQKNDQKKSKQKSKKILKKITQKNLKKFAKKIRLKKLNILKLKKRPKGLLFCGSFDAARRALLWLDEQNDG